LASEVNGYFTRGGIYIRFSSAKKSEDKEEIPRHIGDRTRSSRIEQRSSKDLRTLMTADELPYKINAQVGIKFEL